MSDDLVLDAFMATVPSPTKVLFYRAEQDGRLYLVSVYKDKAHISIQKIGETDGIPKPETTIELERIP